MHLCLTGTRIDTFSFTADPFPHIFTLGIIYIFFFKITSYLKAFFLQVPKKMSDQNIILYSVHVFFSHTK